MILLFEKFNDLYQNSLINDLEKIFPHIKIIGNKIYCSTKLNKSGNPITRIDSKIPILGLLLIIHDDSIEIKSIVNSTGEKGFSDKILKIIFNYVDKKENTMIIIDHDVSDGYWDYIIKKFPQYKFIKK